MSGNYISEYSLNLIKATEAAKNGKNIILCGPERSGKTHIKNQIKDLRVILIKNSQ